VAFKPSELLQPWAIRRPNLNRKFHLVIALRLQLLMQRVKQQRQKLLTVVLLGSAKLGVAVGKRVLEVHRPQLAVLAAPDVLKQRAEMVCQAGQYVVVLARLVSKLFGLVAFGEELDNGWGGKETLKPGIHVASVGEISKPAKAGHGGVGLDVVLQFGVVAASLHGGRLEQVQEAEVRLWVIVATLKEWKFVILML